MATRERPTDRGARLGAEALTRFRAEIRAARLAAGLSHAAAADGAGISRSEWSRIEGGSVLVRDWGLAGRMAAIVGLDLQVRLYPSVDALRDAGQLRVTSRFEVLLGPAWRFRHEVLLPGIRELRAWDAVGVHDVTRLLLKVEAETRLSDHQAMLRRWNRKRADDPGGRFVIVVADTRANRAAITTYAAILGVELPCRGARAIAALQRGEDPGGDVLLIV